MEDYFSSLEHLYFMAFQKIYLKYVVTMFSYLEFLTKHLAVFRLLYLQNNIHVCLFVCLMVFNATFNNISVISWRSVLLMEEAEGPRENHWPEWVKLQVTDKLYLIMLYTSPWSRVELTTSVVIGTDCIGSCKSNYHTITAMTTQKLNWYKSISPHNFFSLDDNL